jgi:hypothetical protein
MMLKNTQRKENYFKALKRLYNLDKQNQVFIDFFNSKTGKIYHYYSNLETIKILLENYKNISTIEKVKENIDFLLNENKELDTKIIEELEKIKKAKTSNMIIKKIDIVSKKLLNIINNETKQFMKKNKINL